MECESAVDRLVLRDGSIAAVRPAMGADNEAVRQFTQRLSPDARRGAFLRVGEIPHAAIRRLCDNANPRRQSLILAVREQGEREPVVAMCWYVAINATTAEVRFVAGEGLQGGTMAWSRCGCHDRRRLPKVRHPASGPLRTAR
jgi:hypothetical protein